MKYTVHKHLESYGILSIGYDMKESKKDVPMSFKQAKFIANQINGFVVEYI